MSTFDNVWLVTDQLSISAGLQSKHLSVQALYQANSSRSTSSCLMTLVTWCDDDTGSLC